METSRFDPVKQKKCRVCATPFTPFNTTDKYCSFACANIDSKKTRKIINKKGNRSGYQREPSLRIKVKRAAKVRDGFQCLLLGVVDHDHDNLREAHHILYLSEGGPDALWNLITLCNGAHKWCHGVGNKQEKQNMLLSIVNGSLWWEVGTISWFDSSDTANQKRERILNSSIDT